MNTETHGEEQPESTYDVLVIGGGPAGENAAFFHFDIGIGSDGVSLQVTRPDDTQEIINAVFGAAA